MIDVSQSVEHDHPRALEFLRRDCSNINDFFKKKGLVTLSVQQSFDFITDITLTEESENDYLTSLFNRTSETMTAEQVLQDEIFKHVYIPRTL